MTSSDDSNEAPNQTAYYPKWLDNLADNATVEGAAMQGVLQGAEPVHQLITEARKLYGNQMFQFTGDYGDGFLEEYTCKIHGEPTSVVVVVKCNAAGKTEHIVVNHRPRSSVLLFARLMGQTFASTPLSKYFIAPTSEARG